jgi:predicted alpha/beta-hydrolase family hydrolase
VYPSDRPFCGLVLAHGAGAGQLSPFLVSTAKGLASRGLSTATFDFAYMAAARRVPDRTPILEQSWRDAITAGRTELKGLPLFIGGKSMGGRIASHVASQGSAGTLAGLIFLGYPLHPPGRPDQRRDAHLPAIAEPMLFVQGSRDAFGSAAELGALMPSLQQATLHVIDGGDHSFKIPGGAARQPAVLSQMLDVVAAWALEKTRT